MPLSGGWSVEASAECFVLRRRPVDEVRAVPLPRTGMLRWGGFRFRLSNGGTSVERGSASTEDALFTYRAMRHAPAGVIGRAALT